MKNIKKLMVVSLVFMSFSNGQLCARVRAMMSQREFEQNLEHKGICVALFYSVTDKRNAPLRQDNKQLQRTLEEVSSKETYDFADLVFIKINTARADFDAIMGHYKINRVPQIVLFYDGQRVVNKHGKPCALTGFVTHKEIESFIDQHCGTEVKKMDMAKEDRQQKHVEEEKKSWLPYFYPRDIFVDDYGTEQRDME